MRTKPLAVLGATGYTGSLVRGFTTVDAALEAGAHYLELEHRAAVLAPDLRALATAALLLARAAEALRDGEIRDVAALASAEAFEPHEFLGRVAPLVQLESVVDL